jgi:hypothetical protein
MPDYIDPDPTVQQLLLKVYKELCVVKEVVLDLQARQKKMDERQQAIRKDFDQSSASDIKGSFATGYEKEK